MIVNKENIKSILERCLNEALELIKIQQEEEREKNWHYTLEYHNNYPTITLLDNGMPSFYLSNNQKIDYSNFLMKDKKYLEIPSWKKFHEYILSNEQLRMYYEIMEYGHFKEGTKDDIKEFHSQIHTYFFISDFVDSYIHRFSLEYDFTNFENLFELFYNSINNEKLEVTIVVPILFVNFNFDTFQINDKISIKKIDKQIQLARNTRKSYTSSAHETVIGAATHAFYLKDWFIDNNCQSRLEWSLSNLDSLSKPLEIIEKLFAALRLISNSETGYCQIISVPVNWQYSSKADLPQIFVASEKRYPNKFENYGWLYITNGIISEKKIQSIVYVFEQIESKQFSLAIKRLNSALLRTNDEDSIIDVTIALESLLTNDSTSEITYRLAIRATQICKLSGFKDYSSKDVFGICKDIYKYRSNLVHGGLKKIEKTKRIESNHSKDIKIINISIDLLKHIIITMIENGIKSINSIDELMM